MTTRQRLAALERQAATGTGEDLEIIILPFDGEEGEPLEIIIPARHRGPVRPAKRGVPQR